MYITRWVKYGIQQTKYYLLFQEFQQVTFLSILENDILSIYLCMCIVISVPIFFLSFYPLSPPFRSPFDLILAFF